MAAPASFDQEEADLAALMGCSLPVNKTAALPAPAPKNLPKPAPKNLPKPSFDQVVAKQSTTGYWEPSSASFFAPFFAQGATSDGAVKAAVDALGLMKPDTAYATLLAIYVLQEAFSDREDEWALLSQKAFSWLKSTGVAKPHQLLNKFSL